MSLSARTRSRLRHAFGSEAAAELAAGGGIDPNADLELILPPTGSIRVHVEDYQTYAHLSASGQLHVGVASDDTYVKEIGVYDERNLPFAPWGQFGDGRMFWGDGEIGAYYGSVTLSHDRDGSLTIQGVNAKPDESTDEADTRLRILQRPDGSQTTEPFVIGNAAGDGDAFTVDKNGALHGHGFSEIVSGQLIAHADDWASYAWLDEAGIIILQVDATFTDPVVGIASAAHGLNLFNIYPDGRIEWGTGDAACDATIKRAAAGVLEIPQSDGGLRLHSPDGTAYTLKVDNAGAIVVA